MDLKPDPQDRITILRPAGRIDQNNAGDFQASLEQEIDKADSSHVVLDMSDVEFISSIGLRALMVGFKKSKAAGGALLIAALTPLVKEIFEISRFDKVLTCFDELDDAIASTK